MSKSFSTDRRFPLCDLDTLLKRSIMLSGAKLFRDLYIIIDAWY